MVGGGCLDQKNIWGSYTILNWDVFTLMRQNSSCRCHLLEHTSTSGPARCKQNYTVRSWSVYDFWSVFHVMQCYKLDYKRSTISYFTITDNGRRLWLEFEVVIEYLRSPTADTGEHGWQTWLRARHQPVITCPSCWNAKDKWLQYSSIIITRDYTVAVTVTIVSRAVVRPRGVIMTPWRHCDVILVSAAKVINYDYSQN